MALPYFQSFLNNFAQNPNDYYLELQQEVLNSQWENTTQSYVVQQQQSIGSDVYDPVDIMVDNVIDMGTGIKKSDDFKTFSHKNISIDTILGLMYHWKNNYWISTNTSDIGSPFKSTVVRRCNNIAKWVDPNSGEIIEIPCVLDYEESAADPKVNKDTIVADGSRTLIIQGNAQTRQIKKNQRFVFDGEPYKFVGWKSPPQMHDFINKYPTIYYMKLDFDVEKPTDDLVNNIADRYQYDFAVTINENPQQQVQGFSGKLTANVTLNGEDTDNVVSWSANEYATIDSSGNYVLVGAVGSTAVFTATFGSFFATVSINIVSNVVQTKEIVVDPLIAELNEQESVVLAANLYINGIKQSDAVTYTASGAASSCYVIVQNNNNFTITNVRRSSMPLQITFSSGVITRQISIKLNALF